MPKVGDRVFPYTTDAICAAFTRACRVLGIEDLHFHDLRHEGVSRLFEIGRTFRERRWCQDIEAGRAFKATRTFDGPATDTTAGNGKSN
jgi:integrase